MLTDTCHGSYVNPGIRDQIMEDEQYSKVVQSTVPSPDTMARPARDISYTDVGAIADHGDAIITWEDDPSVRCSA